MNTSIVVAVIGGVFSLLVALIQRSRRENKEDHNMVYNSLLDLKEDVRSVGDKIDNHIDWHLKK